MTAFYTPEWTLQDLSDVSSRHLLRPRKLSHIRIQDSSTPSYDSRIISGAELHRRRLARPSSHLKTHRQLTMATGSKLVEIVKFYRQQYDQNHQHLSGAERDKGFKRYWNSVSAQALGSAGTGNTLPQKRSSSFADVGMDSRSKRSGHVGIPVP